jgi:hypothetical protein
VLFGKLAIAIGKGLVAARMQIHFYNAIKPNRALVQSGLGCSVVVAIGFGLESGIDARKLGRVNRSAFAGGSTL